jgi:hypothetical protein
LTLEERVARLEALFAQDVRIAGGTAEVPTDEPSSPENAFSAERQPSIEEWHMAFVDRIRKRGR